MAVAVRVRYGGSVEEHDLTESSPQSPESARTFWLRFGLTSVLLALPLAYALVVLEAPPLLISIIAIASAVALLAIWDATRHLPRGWMFWVRPEPMQDAKTGVYNPGAWERHLEMEEDRCNRHDLDACVIAVRLPDDADQPSSIGALLSRACRAHDIVACLDERTFGVLAISTDRTRAAVLVRRIDEALRADGLRATISSADRGGSGSLSEAWTAASLDANA